MLQAGQAVRADERGYTLSIVAAIFLPLGLLGVNVDAIPGTDR